MLLFGYWIFVFGNIFSQLHTLDDIYLSCLVGCLFVYFLPFWTDVILLLNCVCFLHIILYTICSLSLSIYFSCHFVFVSLFVFVWTIRINFHIYHCAYSSYTHTHIHCYHTQFLLSVCASHYIFRTSVFLSDFHSLCLSVSLSLYLSVSLSLSFLIKLFLFTIISMHWNDNGQNVKNMLQIVSLHHVNWWDAIQPYNLWTHSRNTITWFFIHEFDVYSTSCHPILHFPFPFDMIAKANGYGLFAHSKCISIYRNRTHPVSYLYI